MICGFLLDIMGGEASFLGSSYKTEIIRFVLDEAIIRGMSHRIDRLPIPHPTPGKPAEKGNRRRKQKEASVRRCPAY